MPKLPEQRHPRRKIYSEVALMKMMEIVAAGGGSSEPDPMLEMPWWDGQSGEVAARIPEPQR